MRPACKHIRSQRGTFFFMYLFTRLTLSRTVTTPVYWLFVGFVARLLSCLPFRLVGVLLVPSHVCYSSSALVGVLWCAGLPGGEQC